MGLPGKLPRETREKNRRWQIFKDPFHSVQELLMPRCRKSEKEGKTPAWLSKDLLDKLKGKM